MHGNLGIDRLVRKNRVPASEHIFDTYCVHGSSHVLKISLFVCACALLNFCNANTYATLCATNSLEKVAKEVKVAREERLPPPKRLLNLVRPRPDFR